MNAFSSLPPLAFSAPLFDVEQFSVLGELEEEGDAEVIAEVVGQFLEDVDGSFDRLQVEIAEQHFPAIFMIAHTLKGSFATFGMMRAHALAREIEHLAEHDRGENMDALCHNMLGCFMAGKRALQAHMSRKGAPALITQLAGLDSRP